MSYLQPSLGRLLTTCLLAAMFCAGGCKKDSAAGDAGDKTLNLLIFADYIPDSVYASFEKETGIKVRPALVGSNEELLTKVRGGTADYDLVTPSDYMVKRMTALGLLQKLDRGKLPNLSNLDENLLGKPYDPSNEMSVPFFWGTTGIGYDKTKTGGPIDSWTVLFDPKYNGQIAMLDDARELLSAALRVDGQDPNTRDAEAIKKAVERLKQQSELVRLYTSDAFATSVAEGEVALAQGFSGQFAQVVADAPEQLDYVVPKEGGTLWIDNLCITAKSSRAEAAHQFINFLMSPKIAGETANYSAYASPNKAALEFIEPHLRDDKVIYPPPDVLKRCTLLEELGEQNPLVDQFMLQIKK